MVIFPGAAACCGFDEAESVEIDITSSDEYGYIQVDRGASWPSASRYETAVLAWKAPGSTLSLSPVAAPASQAEAFRYYCWTNQQTPVYTGISATDGADFPCSNYTSAQLLSSFRFTAILHTRPHNPADVNASLAVFTSGPRLFYKSGSSVVDALPESDALSDDYLSIADGADWVVLPPRNHNSSTHNISERGVQEFCGCSGRSRGFYLSPDSSNVHRPKGNVGLSLTSCNVPISLMESYGVSGSPTVVATTLSASSTANWYQLDYSLTIDAVRLVFSSSEQALLSGLEAGSC